MSPILVRPVREQLEHDRIIRLLQAKSRRRYEVGINPGNERNAAVGTGASAFYPDLRAAVTRARASAAGGRRGGDRRIGQPPRSAGAMGVPARGCARRFICMCRPEWSMSRAVCAKTTRSSSPRSGAITRSATRSGLRWCTGAARPRRRRQGTPCDRRPLPRARNLRPGRRSPSGPKPAARPVSPPGRPPAP